MTKIWRKRVKDQSFSDHLFHKIAPCFCWSVGHSTQVFVGPIDHFFRYFSDECGAFDVAAEFYTKASAWQVMYHKFCLDGLEKLSKAY